ncbi:hypothetical protein HK102_009991 [Quaeritorhiza haematococci]|nr:hypothetical protein HK102_009991 [Quaeritorhiza haematococci]
MFTPFVAVHVGAGYHSLAKTDVYRTLCAEACEKAILLLRNTTHSSPSASPPHGVNTATHELPCSDHPTTPCQPTAMDAVELAVSILESSPLTNAGIGSNLTLRGTVECDASVMRGSDGAFGAVGAAPGIRNPIKVARRVMEEEAKGSREAVLGMVPPMLIVGEGVGGWCREKGYTELLVSEEEADGLVTEEQKKRWKKYSGWLETARKKVENAKSKGSEPSKKSSAQEESLNASHVRPWEESGQAGTAVSNNKRLRGAKEDHDSSMLEESTNSPLGPEAADPDDDDSTIYDTVGAIALDASGTVVAAVSSGGIALKYSGRIGEAACFGCGVWAENYRPCGGESGARSDSASETHHVRGEQVRQRPGKPGVAISATGTGEQIMRVLLSQTLARHLLSKSVGQEGNEDDAPYHGRIGPDILDVPQILKSVFKEGLVDSPWMSKYPELCAGAIIFRYGVECECEESTATLEAGDKDSEAGDGCPTPGTESSESNSVTQMSDSTSRGEHETSLMCPKSGGTTGEFWFAHTTESMCVGWMSARDKKPQTQMSRKSSKHDKDSIVVFGEPVRI